MLKECSFQRRLKEETAQMEALAQQQTVLRLQLMVGIGFFFRLLSVILCERVCFFIVE